MRLIETQDGWSLALQEGRLGYIHIDFRLGLDFTDALGTASVTIETPCRLSNANEEIVLIPAETKSLTPILELFNADVECVNVQRTGQLSVLFGNGFRLLVQPDEMYEAWQIGCSSCGFLLVCCPGGEISLFQEQQATTRTVLGG